MTESRIQGQVTWNAVDLLENWHRSIAQRGGKSHRGSLPVVTPSLGSSGNKAWLKKCTVSSILILEPSYLTSLTFNFSLSNTGDNNPYNDKVVIRSKWDNMECWEARSVLGGSQMKADPSSLKASSRVGLFEGDFLTLCRLKISWVYNC